MYTSKQRFRERKLIFFSRGITLSKNHPTMTKLELDLHNPTMYPYTKFELNCATIQEIMYGTTKGNMYYMPLAILWQGHKNTQIIG
jgi:hypothetical protein